MERPILLIGGGKGGVGKSLLSVALVDYVSVTDGRPFLVETDTSVPDVFKTYSGDIGAELVNLDEREGWIELVNIVDSHPDNTIVINTGARNQTGISNFGKTLSNPPGRGSASYDHIRAKPSVGISHSQAPTATRVRRLPNRGQRLIAPPYCQAKTLDQAARDARRNFTQVDLRHGAGGTPHAHSGACSSIGDERPWWRN